MIIMPYLALPVNPSEVKTCKEPFGEMTRLSRYSECLREPQEYQTCLNVNYLGIVGNP
jgi:hypothetical protein